ncbi:hypothetical protein UFOVP119_10 [uncultured Caudovirales phage]|uniref:Uncharacterized protein n=1 Tax=uncultured Caudovirales phage TaxID=2100421 RepID=A0A6J5LAV7_9CAUD|nr:hypothetical protein UFOVP119_10 [uncultured Caudovirales phage]
MKAKKGKKRVRDHAQEHRDRVTVAELAHSLEELFVVLAEQAVRLGALTAALMKRDETNRVILAHTHRLVSEKEALLRQIGVMASQPAPAAFTDEERATIEAGKRMLASIPKL